MRRRISTVLACTAICLFFVSGSHAASTPAQKCAAAKMKEIGKYDSCRLKAEASALLKGGAADFSKCSMKLSSKWSKIEAKGGCLATGDEAVPQAETDAHTDAVVALLTDASTCGNGSVDVGEQCDGSDVNGLECWLLGYSFGAGTLACDGACNFDTSGCVQLCGNGTMDLGEGCDGVDFGGATCAGFGGTGTLGCNADCSIDFSPCTFTCGDGFTQPGEECDDVDLAGQTCEFLGFASGTLACSGGCEFDTSACVATCGDSVASTGAGEGCDGTDLGNATTECGSIGYTSGTLACDGGCMYDTSGCALECDYLLQDCPPGEGCYVGIGGSGGCQPAGSAGTFEACTSQSDCEARSACVGLGGTSSVCMPHCDTTIGDADCPSEYTCLATNAPAFPSLGFCIPF